MHVQTAFSQKLFHKFNQIHPKMILVILVLVWSSRRQVFGSSDFFGFINAHINQLSNTGYLGHTYMYQPCILNIYDLSEWTIHIEYMYDINICDLSTWTIHIEHLWSKCMDHTHWILAWHKHMWSKYMYIVCGPNSDHRSDLDMCTTYM
jgi:hypothetical protein